jgi:hypothetical protein
METPAQYNVRASVPWARHKADLALLVVAFAAPIISFAVDSRIGKPDWFARAGAVTTLGAAIVAYRSLSRHYRKFANNMARGHHVETSFSQSTLDILAFVLSIVGTLIWAYGDKLQ